MRRRLQRTVNNVRAFNDHGDDDDDDDLDDDEDEHASRCDSGLSFGPSLELVGWLEQTDSVPRNMIRGFAEVCRSLWEAFIELDNWKQGDWSSKTNCQLLFKTHFASCPV